MKKEFERLKAVLFGGAIVGESLAEVSDLLDNLEDKIDEVEKRMNIAVICAEDIRKTIGKYTKKVDDLLSADITLYDHDVILNCSDDVTIALDLNDDIPIKDNWHNLFSLKVEPKPIAVGNIEYDFTEEVYTIGNDDNSEIIGDVYESEFHELLDLGVIITENDNGFPFGKANYIVLDNKFISIVKKKQIDLTKVPVIENKKVVAPTIQCTNTHTFDKVKEVIQILQTLNEGDGVDGETMEYILEQVGMKEQMEKQLNLQKI